jgi:hypothetical protein
MWPADPLERGLLVSLVIATVLLVATAVPAPFSIDDCNYLTSTIALEHGRVTVPGTDGLLPSRELLAFDPARHSRIVTSSPVAPVVPALYAPLALPLSSLGWRALVFINAAGLTLTTLLVFRFVRRQTKDDSASLLAAVALLFGGAVLDYGQALWPHGLSLALTTGAFVLTARGRRADTLMSLAVAGFLLGWACGVRYQNVLFAAALGLTLLIWHPRRVRAIGVFALGALPPLVTAAFINHARIGSYNPVSKGGQYLTSLAKGSLVDRVGDAILATYARIVDYSANPLLVEGDALLPKDPSSGIFLFLGGLKKAWLQSSPWLSVVVVALVLAWLPQLMRRRPEGVPLPSRTWDERTRELRVISIPVLTLILAFGWAGTQRHEGWCFNQRYLLELVPLGAMTLGLLVADAKLSWRSLVAGAIAGALIAAPFLRLQPGAPLRSDGLMYVPLALALVWFLCWSVRGPAMLRWTGVALGATLGWALAVHVGDDIRAARGRRHYNQAILEVARETLDGERLALVTGPGTRDAVCAIHLERDLLLVDPSADQGADTERLVGELLAEGTRRIYVLGWLPAELMNRLTAGREVTKKDAFFPIVELKGSPESR